MAKVKPVLTDKELLEAAIEGLEAQRARLEEQIADAKARLGARSGPKEKAPATKKKRKGRKKKRTLSPEARKRIAAAQKKRWAKFRRDSGGS